MALLTDALNALAELPQPAVLAAVGLLVLAETTLGLGFLAPGETGLLIAATTVRDHWDFILMCLVVSVCASIGDSIGYLLGRRFGPRLRETRLIRKIGQDHWDRACDLLRRHGGWAVFFARFLPVVRTLTPAASGTSGLPYRRFLPASIIGAVSWAILHVGIGAGAGASAQYIEERLGTASWIVLVALAVIVVLVVVIKSRAGRGKRDPQPTDTGAADSADDDSTAASVGSTTEPGSADSETTPDGTADRPADAPANEAGARPSDERGTPPSRLDPVS